MDLQTWLATVIGTAAALSPLVALAVWFVKSTPLSSRYYPHASVIAGLLLATGISWSTNLIPMEEAWFVGFIAAGIASGGFLLGKSGESSTTQTSTVETVISPPEKASTVVKASSTTVARSPAPDAPANPEQGASS